MRHLQKGLLDTFRKILAIEYNLARKAVHKNNVLALDQCTAYAELAVFEASI